jgi:acyl-Coa thioesterase superfamily protein/acyl-CoA thioesterase superfamily protein
MANSNLPPSFFRQTGEGRYEPTEATIGPWSSDSQHGGPPSALLTNALRTFPSLEDLKIARVTIEFFSAVPIKPCEIKIEKVRAGRKVELLRGQYISGGKIVLLAHVWRIKSEIGISNPISDGFEIPQLPGPQIQKYFPGVDYFPYIEAIEWRFTEGSFDNMGPATVWTRPRIPLIEGSEINGLEAFVLMIDSANGVSAELDILNWTFVPVDLTVGLYRQPIGPWIGMTARTSIGNEGIGQTTTSTFDSKGSNGHSIHTLFVRPR